MSLDSLLPPGLDAYDYRRQQLQAEPMRQLQQASALVNLTQHLRAQQQEEALRQSLASAGGDPEKASAALLAGGHYEAAAKIAPLVKLAQDKKLGDSITNVGSMSADQLDALGQKMAATGHPGAAGIMALADRRRSSTENVAALDTLRGTPMGIPAGSAIPGTNRETIIDIPPEDRAAFEKVAAGAARNQPVSARPDEMGPPQRINADLARLMQSQVPGVSDQARALNTQLQTSGNSLPAKDWITRIDNLAKYESQALERRQAAQTAQGNRIEIHNMFPSAAAQADRAVASAIPEEHANLHGDEYLQTLSPARRNLVKSVAEGLQPITVASQRAGNREVLAAQVAQYSPAAFGGTYATKQAVQKDFTSGVTARNVTSANTVIQHIGTLDEMVDALANKDLRLYNAAANRLGVELGRPEVNNFDIAKQAVGNELMRVFRQVNASEAETHEWESRFTSASSPDQLKGAIKTGVALLKGRIDSIDDQYKRGMGTEQGFPNLVSPKSQAVLRRIGLSVSDTPAPTTAVNGWSIKPK